MTLNSIQALSSKILGERTFYNKVDFTSMAKDVPDCIAWWYTPGTPAHGKWGRRTHFHLQLHGKFQANLDYM